MSVKVSDLIPEASLLQRKWVVARLLCKTDAEAARQIGIWPESVYRWPNKSKLDDAVAALLDEPHMQVLSILADAAIDAAQEKVKGLKSRKELIRQSSASEIMDRILGKPTQHTENKSDQSSDINITFKYEGSGHPSEDASLGEAETAD